MYGARRRGMLTNVAALMSGAGGGGSLVAPTVIFAGASVTLVTTTDSKATLTLTAGAAVGQQVLLATSNTFGRNVTGIIDSKGNTWTQVTAAFIGASMFHCVFACTVTTALAVSDTITVTYAATVNSAHFIVAAQASATGVDATGKGHVEAQDSTTPRTGNNSASPPTLKARAFFTYTEDSDFSTDLASLTDPNGRGWTQLQTVGTTFGLGLFYQDVTAGMASALQLTHSGTNQWGFCWAALDY